MLNFASTFVNSLRNSDVLSPTPKKKTLQHTGCKGEAHGHGTYEPFQRSPSLRGSKKDSSPFQRTGSLRGSKTKPPVPPKPKTASISSENFSESDSIDSSDNKTKSSEEVVRKQNDVSTRLYSNGTKASEAKTAKMRHLDIFDVDEASWMGGLRKNSDDGGALKKKVNNNADKPGDESPFVRSRNGSIKRNGKSETGQSTPKAPPRSYLRGSFRRNKVKCVEYSDVAVMSSSRKFLGYFNISDKSNCLKDLEAFVRHAEVSYSFLPCILF